MTFENTIKAALIDMDGVLYDTMPYHTLAWERMMREQGVECERDEFYLYEGMTGSATINLLFQRQFGRNATERETGELYALKARYFSEYGRKIPMPGADSVLKVLADLDIRRVLVTGSGQRSVLDAINEDYPGMFADTDRVTSRDVCHGKPHPEPYLRGLEIAGVRADQAIVIENAPLGVRAGVAAGCFTIAVTTGPIPREVFERENADIILPSMQAVADWLNDNL